MYDALGVRTTYAYHMSPMIEAQLAKGAVARRPLVRDAIAQCCELLDCFYEPEPVGSKASCATDGSREAGEMSPKAAPTWPGVAIRSRWARAATSLARLFGEQGKKDEGRALLGEAPRMVHGRHGDAGSAGGAGPAGKAA